MPAVAEMESEVADVAAPTLPSTADALPWSPKLKRAARDAYVQGEGSATVLAQRFGVPQETVAQWITDNGWVAMRTEYDRKQRDALLAVPGARVEAPSLVVPIDPMLARIVAQLESVDAQLDEARDDWKAFEALTRAKARLLEGWALLTGHPRPGTRRVRSGRQPAPSAEPVGPAPSALQCQTPPSDTTPGDGAGI
jgi:transposase-like protein